jgi:hypothetical protein
VRHHYHSMLNVSVHDADSAAAKDLIWRACRTSFAGAASARLRADGGGDRRATVRCAEPLCRVHHGKRYGCTRNHVKAVAPLHRPISLYQPLSSGAERRAHAEDVRPVRRRNPQRQRGSGERVRVRSRVEFGRRRLRGRCLTPIERDARTTHWHDAGAHRSGEGASAGAGTDPPACPLRHAVAQ